MNEPAPRFRWALTCPHLRQRASLELWLTDPTPTLVECTALAFVPDGRCDQACLRWFTEAEAPAASRSAP